MQHKTNELTRADVIEIQNARPANAPAEWHELTRLLFDFADDRLPVDEIKRASALADKFAFHGLGEDAFLAARDATPRLVDAKTEATLRRAAQVLQDEARRQKLAETQAPRKPSAAISHERRKAAKQKATITEPHDRTALKSAFLRKMKNGTKPHTVARDMIEHINAGGGKDYGLKNDYREALSPDALKRIAGVKT